MKSWLSEATDTSRNAEILNRTSVQHVLTVVSGKILDLDARDFASVDGGRDGGIPNKIINETALYDLEIARQQEELQSAGKFEAAAKLSPMTEHGMSLVSDYERQKKRIDAAGYMPYDRVIKPLGAAGNLIDTPYEVVRKLKYLEKVSGKEYKLEIFQSRNVVNIISTTDLNLTGFIKTGNLLKGQPEIGDDQEPPITRQVFSIFNKPIFADSFHYQSTMRERSDTGPNIEQEMAKEIPGIMEEMVNTKIAALVKTISTTASLGNWKTVGSNGAFDDRAQDDVSLLSDAINEFNGKFVFISARDVLNAYKLNVQGRNFTAVDTSTPAPARTGILPFNEDLTYYIDKEYASGDLFVIAKDHCIDMYQGPQLDITYKNEKTPGQTVGRMKFNYNGVIKKFDAAGIRRTGAIS